MITSAMHQSLQQAIQASVRPMGIVHNLMIPVQGGQSAAVTGASGQPNQVTASIINSVQAPMTLHAPTTNSYQTQPVTLISQPGGVEFVHPVSIGGHTVNSQVQPQPPVVQHHVTYTSALPTNPPPQVSHYSISLISFTSLIIARLDVNVVVRYS